MKKERELQKKLLKKERKTFRTVMKVLYISVAFVSDLKFAFTDWCSAFGSTLNSIVITHCEFNIYTVSAKKTNIPNIIDCHLKKGYPILIIFGMFILGTNGRQMTIRYFISPNVCFCTTWGKQNQQNISWNEQKYVKKHLQCLRWWLKEGLADFNNFWCKHFWHCLPSNGHSSSRLTKCLLLHYPGKP